MGYTYPTAYSYLIAITLKPVVLMAVHHSHWHRILGIYTQYSGMANLSLSVTIFRAGLLYYPTTRALGKLGSDGCAEGWKRGRKGTMFRLLPGI